MRLYHNVQDMYEETKRDLAEMGIVYVSDTVQDKQVSAKTKELIGHAYKLVSYDDARGVAKANGINMDWLEAESEERIQVCNINTNPGMAWQDNDDFWLPFLRDGAFSYTYAERLLPQLPHIIRELSIHPNSRQAVLTMYDQHQDMMNWGGRDRVPCSMHYQFLMREGRLHCVYSMRSCDFFKFFLSDVVLAIDLLRHIARVLGVKPGSFTHIMGSLHAFEGDLSDVF